MDSDISLNSLPTKPELVNEIEELAPKECGKQKQMDDQTIDAIQFYCNIMSRSEFCVEHKMDSLKYYGEFRSSQKLKELFSNSPNLFYVQNDNVILKNWIVFHLNQQEWLKELLPKSYQSLPNFQIILGIIQFICNMIFTKGHRHCSQIILRTKKHSAIKGMMKTQKEYLQFLSMYPEIFIFKGNKVTLTSSAASYKKNMTSWLKRMVSDSFSTTEADGIAGSLSGGCNALSEGKSDIWSNDVVTNETIAFYYKFLCSITSPNGLLVGSLFTQLNRKCPSKTVIKKFETEEDLKDFLSIYPEVFTIKSGIVFLKNFKSTKLIVSEPDSEHQLNFSRAKESDLAPKNNEKSAIEFYTNIVQKISKENDNITEFPVNHLFCYSLEAPQEVKAIASSALELETFLSKYPNIFKINNDNIIISKAESKKSPIEIGTDFKNAHSTLEGTRRDAVNSYLDLLYQYGGRISMGELLTHIQMFKETVRIVATNFGEVKQFLSSYPDRFIILNDQVIIEDECLEKMNGIYCAIDFFTACMIKEKNKPLPLSLMIDYRRYAPSNVQEIAKNPTELKAFLSEFPQIFSVINDSVTLSKPQDYNVFGEEDKGGLMENDSIDFNDPENVASYFTKILDNHGSCRVLSIHELFEFKLNSSSTIQKISGCDIHQFINFLMEYPDYFLVTGNYVIGKKNIPKCSNHGKYKINKFPDPSLALILNFFKKYTLNNSLFNIDNLYNVGRYFLHNDRSLFFKTKNDLLSFLALYPNVFYVDCQTVINLVTSTNKARIYLRNNERSTNMRHRVQQKPNINRQNYSFSKFRTNKSPKHNESFVFASEQRLKAGSNVLCGDTLPDTSSIDKNNSILIHNTSKSNIQDENTNNMHKSTPERGIDIASSSKRTSIFVQRKNDENSTGRLVDSIRKPKNCFTELQSIDTKKSSECSSFCPKEQLQAVSLGEILENTLSIESNQLMIIKPNSSKSVILDEKTINIPNPKLETEVNQLQTIKLLKTDECSDACHLQMAEQQPIQAFSSISYGDVLEHISSIEKNKGNEKFQNDYSRRFKRPSIREIENDTLAQFAVELEDIGHKKKPSFQCTDYISSKHANTANFLERRGKEGDIEKLTEEALIFLNAKLWEGDELQILNISELYKLFFSESLEITKYYCKSIEDFNGFLCKFPDDFIVSNNNVMAMKNRSISHNIVEECLPIILSMFFDMYTKNNDSITVKRLYERVGQHFYNINHTKIFKFSEQLMWFLGMFPDLFYIDDNLNVINLTSKSKNVNASLERSKCDESVDLSVENKQLTTFQDPESSMHWKDLVLKKTQLIEDKNDCRRITEAILKSENIIAVDCEGVHLGAAGTLSLIQVGLESGDVYIFDIVKDRTMVIDGGLKEIFESESIVKVIHDSRNDVANLCTEYGVEINKIFDTRIAHNLIVNSGVTINNPLHKLVAIGFNELCVLYGAPINIEKDEMKHVYKFNYMIWNERPLSKDMLAYAALDVACLVPQLYDSMLKQLKGVSEDLIWKLSFKYSKSA